MAIPVQERTRYPRQEPTVRAEPCPEHTGPPEEAAVRRSQESRDRSEGGPRAMDSGSRRESRAGSRSTDGTWRYTVPATDASVPGVRHAVRDLLRRQPVPVGEDTLEGLLLILTELVTNAVRHAALLSPQIGVEVSLNGGWLRVAVEDSHPYRPKALDADPFAENTGGRGLLLVKAVTGEAGGSCDVEQTSSGGKIVWAALPLTPPAAA